MQTALPLPARALSRARVHAANAESRSHKRLITRDAPPPRQRTILSAPSRSTGLSERVAGRAESYRSVLAPGTTEDSRTFAEIINPRAANHLRSWKPFVMTVRTDFRAATAAGRSECVTTARTISPAAKDVPALGGPAMPSTVVLSPAVAMSELPPRCGLFRALRNCLPGAARARRTPRMAEPRMTSVSRAEPSPVTPNSFPTARTKNPYRTMIQPTRTRSGPIFWLMWRGDDGVTDIRRDLCTAGRVFITQTG